MKRTRYRNVTIGVAALFAIAFTATVLQSPGPLLLWNASASAPIGLYAIDRNIQPRRGSLVVYRPSPAIAHYLARHQYLPSGVPLLKVVAALPGDHVCRFDRVLTINAKPVAVAKSRDRSGRKLPTWHGCMRLADNELLLLNTAPDSLDGRYFGVMPDDGILGHAHPLFTRAVRDAPLRWHARHTAPANSLQSKEKTT